VFLSELAEEKLLYLNDFLLENWNMKVRNDFISKLTSKINQLSEHPLSCPQSTDIKGLINVLHQNKQPSITA
jgi:plasmid stabilization system protein ParE